MLSLNRTETRSLATATTLVLIGTGLRLGCGPGPADVGWQPPPGTATTRTSVAELRATVEEGVRREERAREPLAAGERVDPNFADEIELRRLPGIGPSLAQAIVRYRMEHGPFENVEELTNVPGIGPAKLAAIRDLVQVP
jgi:competence protein ComEA